MKINPKNLLKLGAVMVPYTALIIALTVHYLG